MALFAEWQTDALAPPPLGPGDAVPVNEYGNIELWTPAHLPPGAVHVRGGRPAQAAKKLGIRYAPAMLGFEGQGRSARPVVEGIVVHESAEEAVRDASRAMEEQRAKKAVRASPAAGGVWTLTAWALGLRLAGDQEGAAGGGQLGDAGQGTARPGLHDPRVRPVSVVGCTWWG